MIERILLEINNFFIKTTQRKSATIDSNTLIFDSAVTLIVGQYVCIRGSVLNDGVYKITEIVGNVYTLDGTLQDETGTFFIYGLAIPKALLDIEAVIVASGSMSGVASESLGEYSVSYGTNGSWQEVYRNQLNPYRKPFLIMGGGYLNANTWCR